MSWSFTQSGPVKQVKDAYKAYSEANPLAEPEKSLRHEGEACLAKIEGTLGRDYPVSITAFGSQSTAEDGAVTALNVSITITSPIPA